MKICGPNVARLEAGLERSWARIEVEARGAGSGPSGLAEQQRGPSEEQLEQGPPPQIGDASQSGPSGQQQEQEPINGPLTPAPAAQKIDLWHGPPSPGPTPDKPARQRASKTVKHPCFVWLPKARDRNAVARALESERAAKRSRRA